MSAWAQAVWIVNKLLKELDLGELSSLYNGLKEQYGNLLSQKLTLSSLYQFNEESGEIIFPDPSEVGEENFHDGTICILYEDDTIIDLTNTKWQFNDQIYIARDFSYNINFTYADDLTEMKSIGGQNNTNTLTYVSIDTIEGQEIEMHTIVYSQNSIIQESSGWTDDEYKTISITGGQDVTSLPFYNWLQRNAIPLIQEENEGE